MGGPAQPARSPGAEDSDPKAAAAAEPGATHDGAAAIKSGGAFWCKMGANEMTIMQAVLVVVVCIVPNILVVVVLSDVGAGLKLYNALAPTNMSLSGDAAICLATLSITLLYVVDWFEWKSRVGKVVALVVPVALMTAGAFLKARKYPWAPLLFTLFLVPVVLGVLRSSLLKDTRRSQFYKCVALGTAIAASGVFVAWILWMVPGDHLWNRATKDDLSSRSGNIYRYVHPDMELDYVTHCHPELKNLTGYGTEKVKGIISACSVAANIWFLVWLAPFIAVICDGIVSIFCMMQGHKLHAADGSVVVRALKQFLLGVTFLLFGMYGTVSFTSLSLNATIMAFFCAALTTLVVWAFIEIGTQSIVGLAHASPFAKHLSAAWRSDWVRAIAVGSANVFIPIYFLLNRMNQMVRNARHGETRKYTAQAEKLLKEIEDWNWVGILNKVAILAEMFFTLQVGVSKVTYIFLSWLSRQLAAVNFGLVCVLVFCIGFVMFMLPPVPGIPVYVFSGIVIADQGDRKLGGNGFIWGILIAIGVAFINKLAACNGQYAIGYFLGGKTKVQQLIKVDSVPTRAIESIVKRPGFDPAKVAILIGGPDWPTSVGCGMVKVNVVQMTLGTMPVLFLMAPCVLAGAFIARQGAGGPDSIFPMLTNLSLVVATVTQAAAGLTAGAYILKEIQAQGEELAKYRPEHAAVAELTRKEEHSNRLYEQVTKWDNLNLMDKCMVISMAAALEFSCFLFVMAAEACFRPFSVDKDIDAPWEEGGLNGDPTSIVLVPVGSFALGLFAFGVVLHVVHSKTMGCRHREALKNNPPPALSPNAV